MYLRASSPIGSQRQIACVFILFVDQRLAAFHQTFSWTSAGSLKFLIDEMISWQSHLTVWAVP